MGKWMIEIENEHKLYDSYEKAKSIFLSIIKEYLTSCDDIFHEGLMFDAGSFFNYYYQNSICPIKIPTIHSSIISNSKSMLNEFENGIVPINFYDENDMDESLTVLVDSDKYCIDYCAERHSYVHTNICNMKEKRKLYYFKSKQELVCSSDENTMLLGESYDLTIKMAYISDEKSIYIEEIDDMIYYDTKDDYCYISNEILYNE